MTDNFRWESKAFVVRSDGVCFHEAMVTHCSVMYQVDNTRDKDLFIPRTETRINTLSKKKQPGRHLLLQAAFSFSSTDSLTEGSFHEIILQLTIH
jgi:hypothetical protein